MKQIWLIIEWQLPDGAGRVVKVIEGWNYEARTAAQELHEKSGGVFTISEVIK